MTTMPNFTVTFAETKSTEKAIKEKDTRPLARRMFHKIDKETGEEINMPIKAVDCSTGTYSEQNIDYGELVGAIPFFLNYKGDLPDKAPKGQPQFNGDSKGRDQLVIGRRPRGGSGVMVDVDELDILIEELGALRDAVRLQRPAIRQAAGLPVTEAMVTAAEEVKTRLGLVETAPEAEVEAEVEAEATEG